jgi:hypothetical protein
LASKDGNGAGLDGYYKTRSISLTVPYPQKYPWYRCRSESKPTGYPFYYTICTPP